MPRNSNFSRGFWLFAAATLVILAACGKPSQLSAGQEETTTTSSNPAPGGLECDPNEIVVTVQAEFARDSEGNVDLEEAAVNAEEAVDRFIRKRFPGLKGSAEKDGNEFKFKDERQRQSLVIRADKAQEGWYVVLYHACEGFETEIRSGR